MNLKRIIHVALLASVVALGTACQPQTETASNAANGSTPTDSSNQQTSETGGSGVTELQINDIEVGDGATATAGQTVIVHYTGWLYDPDAADNRGTKFDSSVDRGTPFDFPLGGGRVIKGWDEGVAGMNIGGKRVLIIPPDMGYGARGAGGAIPPNATLLFEVELLELR
jgi:FKBP-type peptidyl-prolyl cis-trans isomerase FkpA